MSEHECVLCVSIRGQAGNSKQPKTEFFRVTVPWPCLDETGGRLLTVCARVSTNQVFFCYFSCERV